jgi:tRNA (guanosine-2'-O-)-methyltransferase
VDRVCHQTPEAAIGELAKEGYELVATDPAGPMLPHDLTLVPKLALVLGNERDGICETLRRAARRTVRIPMRGFVESLNVSVSAAILLHAATEGRPGDLPESDRLRLYARGLHGSVARADDVLRALPPC